jgi:hypothetical protein
VRALYDVEDGLASLLDEGLRGDNVVRALGALRRAQAEGEHVPRASMLKIDPEYYD